MVWVNENLTLPWFFFGVGVVMALYLVVAYFILNKK